MPSPRGDQAAPMYFWTLPGPAGAVLGAVVAVETSSDGLHTGDGGGDGRGRGGTGAGAEVLRDRTWARRKAVPLACTHPTPQARVASRAPTGPMRSHGVPAGWMRRWRDGGHDDELGWWGTAVGAVARRHQRLDRQCNGARDLQQAGSQRGQAGGPVRGSAWAGLAEEAGKTSLSVFTSSPKMADLGGPMFTEVRVHTPACSV